MTMEQYRPKQDHGAAEFDARRQAVYGKSGLLVMFAEPGFIAQARNVNSFLIHVSVEYAKSKLGGAVGENPDAFIARKLGVSTETADSELDYAAKKFDETVQALFLIGYELGDPADIEPIQYDVLTRLADTGVIRMDQDIPTQAERFLGIMFAGVQARTELDAKRLPGKEKN